MPIDPSELRLSYEVLSRTPPRSPRRSAPSKQRSRRIERLFAAAGIEVVLIEPVRDSTSGTPSPRAKPSDHPRPHLLLHPRARLHHRRLPRHAAALHPLAQSQRRTDAAAGDPALRDYLRDTLQTDVGRECYVAGNGINGEVTSSRSAASFGAGAKDRAARRRRTDAAGTSERYEAELTAATGVFTG